MKTNDDVVEAAAVSTVGLGGLVGVWDSLTARMSGCFSRSEPRARAVGFVRGLVGMQTSRNGWSMAEYLGAGSPDGVQRLLNKACWDQEAVLARVRGLIAEHLSDPDAVLAIDETGDQKKGVKTVGVQRQYSGTCGRIENCQVTVFASYVTACGHTLVDARLYLPASWTEQPARLDEAGVPADQREFATKPAIARDMIEAALAEDVPFAWVAADEVYGAEQALRTKLRQAGKGYVLAVAANHRIQTPHGTTRVDHLVAGLPPRAWTRHSAGAGAQGHRLYDWTLINLPDHPDQVLARRNRATAETAFYRCYAPTRTPLAKLARVAGARWPIETDFQTSKNECGLDQHQLRTFTAHRRWLILVIAAHAVLAITTALARHAEQQTHSITGNLDDELIPLTLPETRRLLQALILNPTTDPDHLTHLLHWSRWRRRRQAQARRSHYQQQELTL